MEATTREQATTAHTACTREEHDQLGRLSIEEWRARTVPLATGERPIAGGLEFGDCRRCYEAVEKRYTFTRAV